MLHRKFFALLLTSLFLITLVTYGQDSKPRYIYTRYDGLKVNMGFWGTETYIDTRIVSCKRGGNGRDITVTISVRHTGDITKEYSGLYGGDFRKNYSYLVSSLDLPPRTLVEIYERKMLDSRGRYNFDAWEVKPARK